MQIDSRWFPLLLVTAGPALSQNPTPPVLVPKGQWGTPVQHDTSAPPGFVHVPVPKNHGRIFKMLHMALIPQPAANAGLVVGWDQQVQSPGTADPGWYQRWSVIDPATDPPTVLWNDELHIPGIASGDLFCAGLAWMADGRLLVAGGTSRYPRRHGDTWRGARLALIFDPTPTKLEPYGHWQFLPRMAKDRWYPTVTQLGDGRMVVTGGKDLGTPVNSYEVWDPVVGEWEVDPATGDPWFPGPSGAGAPELSDYRRMHLLSNGELFMSGAHPRAARLDHANNPGVWTLMSASSNVRHDGASVLRPRNYGLQDKVMILGGSHGSAHGEPDDTTETCLPLSIPAPWSPGPTMIRERVHLNSVLLPDRTILSFGGDGRSMGVFRCWKDVEWLSGGSWKLLAEGASVRNYHSTAVLLPDGNVLSAGGDFRSWDYQLFSPVYFDATPVVRPTNVKLSKTQFGYAAGGSGPYTATFDLSAPHSIRRVVMMMPGATTHHSDMGQRFVDLKIHDQSTGSVTFDPPFNSCARPNPTFSCAPPGYYMLFLVTNRDVPSEAVFVQIQ